MRNFRLFIPERIPYALPMKRLGLFLLPFALCPWLCLRPG
jgi:hypothetical protein